MAAVAKQQSSGDSHLPIHYDYFGYGTRTGGTWWNNPPPHTHTPKLTVDIHQSYAIVIHVMIIFAITPRRPRRRRQSSSLVCCVA